MDGIDQQPDQQPDCLMSDQPPVTGFGAKTAVGANRTREVQSRYLQSKRTPAVRRPAESVDLAGRHSLAACSSTGWVELQLGTTVTPFMQGSASSSAAFGQKTTAQQMQTLSISAPAPTPRAVRCQPPQQRQHVKSSQRQKNSEAMHHIETPSAAPAFGGIPQAANQQQQYHHQLHDVQRLPDTSRRLSSASSFSQHVSGLRINDTAAFNSPRSSRSSTGCTTRQASAAHGIPPLLRQADPTELCTPQVPRLTSSVVIGHGTAIQAKKLGMSADVAALPAYATTVAKGADDMRRKLEEYKQQKRLELQQVAQRNATRGSQGGFKEPQPRAWKQQGVSANEGVVPAAAGPATPVAGCTVASVEANTSPSQFTATMKTLQQSGSGSKSSKPVSSNKLGPKLVRPTGVPVLQMDRLQQAANTASVVSHVEQQQLTARSPLVPGSYSRIPQFSTGGQAQEEVTGPLLSSRVLSNAAHVPLPDATPRAIRDAPLSKLPKTPRGDWNSVEVEENDVAAKKPKPVVPGLRLGGLGGTDPSQRAAEAPMGATAVPGVAANRNSDTGPNDPVVTASKKTVGGHAVHVAGSMLVAAATARPVPTPLSARRTSSVGTARQAGRYTSSSSSLKQQQQELARPLKPPRLLTTPRPVVGGRTEVSRSDQERVEETRQQLRLLRNQNVQLRHLAARVETAVQQKQGKAATALASAAAALVDLYGQLTAVQKQLQQQQWQSALTQVVQRQLPRLREWCTMQDHSQVDASCQLQHACSAALSHVPLLNGASVGQNPEQPDLELLQQQLVHGMQMLQEVQPALQKLLGPDLQAAHMHTPADAAAGESVMCLSTGGSSNSKTSDVRHSIRTTALLADQLMCVAAEECSLLSQLAQQMGCLSDLHLYANSMYVQLAQMKQSGCTSPF